MNILALTQKEMSWPVLAIMMITFFAALLAPMFGAPFYLMFIPAIPICLLGVIISTALLIHSRASRHWPPVECKILSSSVERKVNLTAVRQGGSGAHYWAPHIEFEFSVDRKRYKAVDLGIGMVWSGDKQVADSYVEGFPVGSESVAYYNPANPTEACLTTNKTRAALIGLAISSGLSIASIMVVIILWKWGR